MKKAFMFVVFAVAVMHWNFMPVAAQVTVSAMWPDRVQVVQAADRNPERFVQAVEAVVDNLATEQAKQTAVNAIYARLFPATASNADIPPKIAAAMERERERLVEAFGESSGAVSKFDAYIAALSAADFPGQE